MTSDAEETMFDDEGSMPNTNSNHVNSITAVIPAYNESATIGRIVTQVRTYVDQVIVVDDGSSDDTAGIALAAGAEVLRHAENQGYGSALSTGFKHVKNNGAGMMVVLDGDGQHNPDDIPTLTRLIVEGKADIVTGSRFMRRDDGKIIPAYRRFGIGIVNRGWKMAGGAKMTDTQCGFRAYSRAAIDSINITERDMSASLEILDQAAHNRLRLIEVPMSVTYKGTTSTATPGKHGMELVNYLLRKLREEHPLLIFGGLGLAFMIVGFGVGIVAVNSYLESGYLPFGPTILAGLIIYVGTLMIFGGLILNSIQILANKLTRNFQDEGSQE